jgi:hypothetical protein
MYWGYEMLFYIEVTDTLGGEANYSWVTRHIVRGASIRGALQRFSRMSGMHWHGVGSGRYDSASGATCLFIDEFDGEVRGSLNTDERESDSIDGRDYPKEV